MKRILVASFALGALAAQAAPLRFHIGTYSVRGSAGIYTATLDSETGALSVPLSFSVSSKGWGSW